MEADPDAPKALRGGFRARCDYALSALSIFLAVAATGFAQPAFVSERYDVRVTRAIVYGHGEVSKPEPGTVELLLDLYEPVPAADPAAPDMPQTAESPQAQDPPPLRPGFLLIHGGGFIRGDRDSFYMVALARAFARRGYVCASIDYRLARDGLSVSAELEGYAEFLRTSGRKLKENPWWFERFRANAAALEDSHKAASWMIDNADRIGLDPENLFVGGDSAGAVTAIGLAYAADDLGLDPPVKFRGVLDLWGLLTGPLEWIQAGEPALVIIHGTEDNVVPFEQCRALHARARAVGLPLVYYSVPGAGHGMIELPLLGPEAEHAALLDDAFRFFERQMTPGMRHTH